jgi:two-component system sensor histidine kinase/response regulator
MTATHLIKSIKKFYFGLIGIGITNKLNEHEKRQVKMVNYVTFFAFLIGIAFFLQGLKFETMLMSFGRISNPILMIIVLVLNHYGRYKIARNLLFIVHCISIGLIAITEDNTGFTMNFYFGMGMLSFVLYDKIVSKIVGLLVCVLFYFVILYSQIEFHSELSIAVFIKIFDAIFLFLSIAFCMNYFIKTNLESNGIILEKNLELEKININKSKILSILTHDIRNPINSLIQLLELQQNKVMNADELNFVLDGLRNNFISQFQSIENLLQWSKHQIDNFALNIEKTDVDQVVTELVHELKYNLSMKEINLELNFCGSDIILVDKTHLLIVLRNIITNAIKFTHKGGNISIDTHSDSNYYRIDLVDDGIGFHGYDEVFKEINFIKSQKGTNNENGNGLGLLLSKELMEKNNGSILIKKNKNGGTTIRLLLNKQTKYSSLFNNNI